MYDRKSTIELIEQRFPELVEDLHDKIFDGLLHLQIGAFSRFAQKAIDSGNKDCWDRITETFIEIWQNCDDRVTNALNVSFLEHLNFDSQKVDRQWAFVSMPVLMREAWQAMDVYLKKMNLKSSPVNPLLILERFNGFESYSIETAAWNLYKDRDSGMMNLWISLQTGKAIEQLEDTKNLFAEPNWELNLVDRDLAEDAIQPNFIATIPKAYDESRGGWITNFYYCEHEGSDRNTIEIVEVDGDRVRFRLSGETVDVNYYDGSKPPTKLSVDIWFRRDRDARRSMS